MSFKKTTWELILISSIALFLELAIIRWLSAEVRIFAYFKNLPLMAAFLGFGIGFFLHRGSDRIFPWFPRLAFLLVFIIAWANRIGITHVIFVDPRQYFLLGIGFGDHAIHSMPSLFQTVKAIFVIVSLFFLTMATFLALTSKVGEMINKERPLIGYSVNVVGSLLGIAGFSLVSYLEWPPTIWLIFVFTPMVYFYRDRIKLALVYFFLAIICTLVVPHVDQITWSPYYRISVRNDPSPYDPDGKQIIVNYDGFQGISNLSEGHMRRFPESVQKSLNRHYNIPYLLSKRKIQSVLILGGGAGNDAAAAIRNGAARVDVVEIDPAIARIGCRYHSENPYKSKRVNLYIEDARSFLKKTEQHYDLIVFGGLDSHTVFSSLSSLRLDNFVFTKESLINARNRLNPGGGIAIDFFVAKSWLFLRHYDTLKDTMGMVPLVYGGGQSVTLLAGDIFDGRKNSVMTDYAPIKAPSRSAVIEPITDDWPFLFLEKRGIPFHYLLPLLIIFALSSIPLRMSQIRVHDIDWQLFFMGTAFFLIETKAVTTLALIAGSTWIVNSIVFSGVLFMILLANFLVGRLSFLPFSVLYLGLFASLLFNYYFPFDVLNQFDWIISTVTGGAVISCPFFIAALIFAKAFESVKSPSISLASNVLGALLGGMLEYLDMWTGLRALNIVAVILYFLSLLFLFAKNHPLFRYRRI